MSADGRPPIGASKSFSDGLTAYTVELKFSWREHSSYLEKAPKPPISVPLSFSRDRCN